MSPVQLPPAAPAPNDSARAAAIAPALPAVDSVFRAFAERAHVPGIAYGVIVGGHLVHVGTAGLRDVAARAPVDTTTVFRIASMTKSFTAAAILQLRDAGKLALDDPASKYVPEMRTVRGPTGDAPVITIRHLLTHSEGFPEDNAWGDRQLAVRDDELSRTLRDGVPFSTTPGTAYEYSNLGFAILGRIVARASGMPYARYMATRVFAPLGMRHTYLEPARVPAERRAVGHRWQDGAWALEPSLADGAYGPMGGMLTSVGDLSRWVAFLADAWPPRDGADSPVLSRASRREMQQLWRFSGTSAARDPMAGLAFTTGGYGYGLAVRHGVTAGMTGLCRQPLAVSHSGGLPGWGSIMRWFPESGVGVVALGNLTYTSWGAPLDSAVARIARTGALAPRPVEPAPVLVERQREVSRLVATWDDALADRVAAMNLFLDESRDGRRTELARLVREAGGSCRPEGALVAENALRGRWRMRCATGDLRVAITLAPTQPARVQVLDVRAMRPEESLDAAVCR